MAEKTYAGSIKNQGSQVVEAPFATKGNKGKGIFKTGGDLRTGK